MLFDLSLFVFSNTSNIYDEIPLFIERIHRAILILVFLFQEYSTYQTSETEKRVEESTSGMLIYYPIKMRPLE